MTMFSLQQKVCLKEIKATYNTDQGFSIIDPKTDSTIPLDELTDEDLLTAFENLEKEVCNG